MKWKIEVRYKPGTPDAAGQGILQDIGDLGITGVESVRTAQVYWIQGHLHAREIERVCSELLADSVTQDYRLSNASTDVTEATAKTEFSHSRIWTIEVRFKPGVTDTVGDSVIKGIHDLNISGIESVQTGQKYWVHGNLNHSKLETIAQRLLANGVIQTFDVEQET